MDILYTHRLPTVFLPHLKISQLNIPPGVNPDRLSEIVGNQIASTIIHEAAHGKRWAQEYLSGRMKIEESRRSEEESIAERAEQKAGLNTDITDDILDPNSQGEQTISEDQLLTKAIEIANSKNEFYIPRSSVKNVKLGPSQWGQFEMIQGPDTTHENDITIAWDKNDRKLMVDVSSIIDEYNKAMSHSQTQNNNVTQQVDGQEPDVPGVSQDSPASVISPSSSTGIGAVPTASSIGSVPSR